MVVETRKMKSKVGNKKGHTYIQWIVAIIANSSLLSYGLQAGWISPTAKILQSESSPTGAPLSDNTMALVASLMPIGALASVTGFAYVADTCGRKTGILLITAPHAVAWLLKLIYPTTTSLIIARFCCGIAAGGCFNVIPMYTKEISQDNIRGLLGSLLIFFHNLGIFLMFLFGAYLDYYPVLYVVIGLPFLSFLFMLKCPESPGYLVKTGQYEEAVEIIAYLRGLDADDRSIQNEVDAMKKEDEYFKTLPSLSMIVILKNRAWRKALILALLVIFVQTCSGHFTIVTYGSTILAASGTQMKPELLSICFPAIMMVGSIVSIIVVERIGRKVILGSSFFLTVFGHTCLATILLLHHQGSSAPAWLSVLAIILSMFAYAFGVLPVPYIVMTEIFNIQIRGKLFCLTIAQAWLLTYLQLTIFPPFTNAFGMYTTFYGFAGINLLGFLIVLVLMPETRGRSIEQEAVEIIAYLRGLDADDRSIQNEVDAMKKEDEYFKTLPSLSMIVILKNRAWRKALILALLVIFVQTCSGHFTIVTYGSTILAASGTQMKPELLSICFPAIMMVGSIVSIIVVERIGRKVILGSSFFLTVFGHTCLATILLLHHQGSSAPAWLSVLAIILSMFAYAFGVLPVPYIVMTEIFNIQIRGKLFCLTIAQAWLLTYLQLTIFPPFTNAFGMYTTFYGFAGINLLGFLIVLVLMPETRGRSIEQVEEMFKNK